MPNSNEPFSAREIRWINRCEWLIENWHGLSAYLFLGPLVAGNIVLWPIAWIIDLIYQDTSRPPWLVTCEFYLVVTLFAISLTGFLMGLIGLIAVLVRLFFWRTGENDLAKGSSQYFEAIRRPTSEQQFLAADRTGSALGPRRDKIDMMRSGAAIIEACREIVASRRAGEIGGTPIELFDASAVLCVYEAEKRAGREDKFLRLSLPVMLNKAHEQIG